jgi:hypothetical protein
VKVTADLPGWGVVIVRGTRRLTCSAPGCTDPASYLCDHPRAGGAKKTCGGAKKTCGQALCERHARIQPGRAAADGSALCHYCPEHDKERRP